MKGFVCFIYTVVLIFEGISGMKDHDHRQRRATCGDSNCKAPVIKLDPRNSTVPFGEKKTLRCRAQGKPLPEITWEKNDIRIDNANKHYTVTNTKILTKSNTRYKAIKSSLDIYDLYNKDLGIYTCVAKNKVGVVKSKSAFITVDPEKIANANNIPGSSSYKNKRKVECVSHINATACWRYLDSTRSVYSVNGNIYLQETFLKVLATSLRNGNDHLSASCRPFALPFLCYYNYPYCSRQGKPKKVTICRSDCIRLSSIACQVEFQEAKTDEVLKALIPKNCNMLPEKNCFKMNEEMEKVARMHNAKLFPRPPPPVTDPQQVSAGAYVDPRDNCYYNDGADYRGIINITKSNKRCLPWSDIGLKSSRYLDGHNYCRNIDSTREKPWCYYQKVTSQGFRVDKEYCEVPQCAIPLPPQTASILYTIIPCLLFALALSSAIIMLAWRRHKQHFYQSGPSTPKQLVPRVNPKIQELNREDLCDYRLLGDGNFGRVYTADYTGSKNGFTFTACVAVKAIIEKTTAKHIEDFVREAETRANFKHDNVVSLIGVISKEEPLSLIYEYTEFGDLHEYLLRHSPNFSDAHANDDCEPLEYSDLLVIATQIASGMTYLSTHAFVHKDLAVRNCIVDNGIIKISDFSGLCDQYAGDYYRVAGRLPIPARWMSPESLSEMTYTSASDVWSYGVCLWEIFSYGSRPYFGLNNQQAIDCILDYKLLPCPEGCSKSVYSIMSECWIIEANSRPSFVEIYNRLKSLNDVTSSQSNVPSHPDASLHSLQSNSLPMRDMTPSNFQRHLSSKSHDHSLHSRPSSNHSANSAHVLALHSTIPSIPPSLISMPHSISPYNDYAMTSRTGHHSLPRDVLRTIPIEERLPPHGGISPHNGHYSLPRDRSHLYQDKHYPYPHTDLRPSSNNSSHHHSALSHSSGCYLPPASYVSSMKSYPSSINGPPVSMFSRPHESRTSSRAASVKSYDSVPGKNSSMSMGSHIYL